MKVIRFIILSVLTVSMFFGCKKGDNDPFLSLLSRKARLTGEWKLVDGSITETSATSIESITYTESTQATYDGTNTTTVPYTETYTFEKDGSYTHTYTEDGDTYIEEGAWTFGAANKELDVKSKETVILYCQTYTYPFMGSSYTYQYTGTFCLVNHITLDMLKKNEMTVLTDYAYTGTSDSYTKAGTMTYEKQ